MVTNRERLIEAAFALFAERGFDTATVDDIAARAGVSRATFFRAFGSKEDVIFPDHDAMLAGVEERLRSATRESTTVAVKEAAHLVLAHYLAEGDRARQRYTMTRAVPALRERETASLQRYQRTFTAFLRTWQPEGSGPDLHAELMANAIVTAHNHVLRQWLRGSLTAVGAEEEFTRAMDHVVRIFGPDGATGRGGEVLLLRTAQPLDDLLPALRDLLEHPPSTDADRVPS